jgi:hypothetical protein
MKQDDGLNAVNAPGGRGGLFDYFPAARGLGEMFIPLCAPIERDIASLYHDYIDVCKTYGRKYTIQRKYERFFTLEEVLNAFREGMRAGITCFTRSVYVRMARAGGLWGGIAGEARRAGVRGGIQKFPAREYLENTFEPFHHQIETRMWNRVLEGRGYRIEFIPASKGVDALSGESLHIDLA